MAAINVPVGAAGECGGGCGVEKSPPLLGSGWKLTVVGATIGWCVAPLLFVLIPLLNPLDMDPEPLSTPVAWR